MEDMENYLGTPVISETLFAFADPTTHGQIAGDVINKLLSKASYSHREIIAAHPWEFYVRQKAYLGNTTPSVWSPASTDVLCFHTEVEMHLFPILIDGHYSLFILLWNNGKLDVAHIDMDRNGGHRTADVFMVLRTILLSAFETRSSNFADALRLTLSSSIVRINPRNIEQRHPDCGLYVVLIFERIRTEFRVRGFNDSDHDHIRALELRVELLRDIYGYVRYGYRYSTTLSTYFRPPPTPTSVIYVIDESDTELVQVAGGVETDLEM
jgi:hypothetical protein